MTPVPEASATASGTEPSNGGDWAVMIVYWILMKNTEIT